MKISVLIFLLIALFPSGRDNAYLKENDWEKLKGKNNIEVFIRHNTQYNTKEIKAVCDMNTNLSAAIHLLKKVSIQKEWAYSTLEARILKEYNNKHWVNYSLIDLPWPAANRDCITSTYLSQGKDSVVQIKSCLTKQFKYPDNKAVHLPFVQTIWTLEPLAPHKTRIHFQSIVKVGGSIPNWIVNLFIDQGPYNTLLGFRKEVEKDIYQNIVLSYVKEKA